MARNTDAEPKDGQFRWLEVDGSDVRFLVKKHLGILILAPLLGIVLACGIAKCLKPIYATSVEVFLRPNFDKEIQVDQTVSKLDDMDSLRSVEHAIISDTVILAMIDRLGLRGDPDFLGETDGPEKITDDKLLKTIRKRFSAKLVPATRILELKVEDYSAKRTAVIAETLIDEFLQHLRKDRDSKAAELRLTLAAQAAKALERALECEKSLKEFRSNNPDIVVEQDSSIAHEQLLQNGVALNEATSRLSELEGMIEALSKIDVEKDPFQVFQILTNRNSDYLSELLTMHAAAKSEFARAQGRYTEQHPEYRSASDRLAEVEATLRSYAGEMKAGVTSEYDATSRKVASLSTALSGMRESYVGMKSTSADFRGIKEEADRNWNTHSSLQQKIMDLDLNPEVTPTFATVTSGPTVPDKKAWPRMLYFAAGGVFSGVLGALATIFWVNRGGLPFTSCQQVTYRLKIPTIAAFQTVRGGSPESQLAEIEMSQHFINFMIALRKVQLVHVTSIIARPEASLLPKALARTCARHHKRTLLVTFGLNESLDSRVLADAANPGLMTVDLPVWVLFDFERFRDGLFQLQLQFDLIVLDTTGVIEDEARFAVASVSEHNVLTVHGGGEMLRGGYQHFVEALAAVAVSSTSAVYFSSSAPVRPLQKHASPLARSRFSNLSHTESRPLPEMLETFHEPVKL